MSLPPAPGQTIGPFYGYVLPFKDGEKLVDRVNPGSIRQHVMITDGAGETIPDAPLEIWQADKDGHVVCATGSLVRDDHTFTGFGRVAVDNVGHYTFTTVNPGATEAGKAPFILLNGFARCLLNRLFTRIYLPEDTEALATDPLLNSMDEAARFSLIVTREANGDLRFDISLQGKTRQHSCPTRASSGTGRTTQLPRTPAAATSGVSTALTAGTRTIEEQHPFCQEHHLERCRRRPAGSHPGRKPRCRPHR